MVLKFVSRSSLLVFNLFIAEYIQAQPISELTHEEMHYSPNNIYYQYQYTTNKSRDNGNIEVTTDGTSYILIEDTQRYSLYDKLEPNCETRELWLKSQNGGINVFEDDTGDYSLN